MDMLLDLLKISLSEEDRQARRRYLRYLRDITNPFDVEDNVFRDFVHLPKLLAIQLINELAQHNEESSDLPFSMRVLSALHYYGHGSYQRSVASNYLLPMSQPSISRNITFICQLMVTKMSRRVKFCENPDEKNAIKEGFYTKFGIKGVIGAIDCTHVGIVAPPIYEPDQPPS